MAKPFYKKSDFNISLKKEKKAVHGREYTLADRTLEKLVSKDRQEVGRGKTGGRSILHGGSQSQGPRWGGAGLAGPEGNTGHVGDSLDFAEARSSARLPQTV